MGIPLKLLDIETFWQIPSFIDTNSRQFVISENVAKKFIILKENEYLQPYNRPWGIFGISIWCIFFLDPIRGGFWLIKI